MTEPTQDLSLAQARALIDSYAFDLGRGDAEQLLEYWLDLYHASWIRLATIEALYLGRYKAISIEHILNVWLRLGTPNPHFTYEFERLICRKLPKHLSNLTDITTDTPATSVTRDFSPTVEEKIESPSINQQIDRQLPVAIAANDTPNLSKAFGNPDSYSEPDPSIMSAMGFSSQSPWTEFTQELGSAHKGDLCEAVSFRAVLPRSVPWVRRMSPPFNGGVPLTAGSKTIHQFIPLPDMSSFFLKLKTFGESK